MLRRLWTACNRLHLFVKEENKLNATIRHPESFFCGIVGNKAFLTHLLEEDKIIISLAVFFFCQTFFQQFNILICF